MKATLVPAEVLLTNSVGEMPCIWFWNSSLTWFDLYFLIKWWTRSHVWEDGWTHFRMENWCYCVIRSSCSRCHPDTKPEVFCRLQQTAPTNAPYPPWLQWPHWPVLTVLTAEWFEWEMSPIGLSSLHPVWSTVWEFCRCGKVMEWPRS